MKGFPHLPTVKLAGSVLDLVTRDNVAITVLN